MLECGWCFVYFLILVSFTLVVDLMLEVVLLQLPVSKTYHNHGVVTVNSYKRCNPSGRVGLVA